MAFLNVEFITLWMKLRFLYEYCAYTGDERLENRGTTGYNWLDRLLDSYKIINQYSCII